jgi:mannose-6-phosphate isomerase-like protein (cupin superfamily)
LSAAPATVATRRFSHPMQRDRATFLETSEESRGERTLVELEVAPGGGNTLHRHLAFSERFEVLEGELAVHVDGEDVVLWPGDCATAPIGSLHHFANRTDETVTATVELRPGSLGFERAIQIAYGLAEDGRVNKSGVPRNLMHLGLLAEMADSQLTGVLCVIEPALRALARRARRKGVDRELIARYCNW